MTRESKIYAKEEQLKLIDNILCSLCSVELTSEGRKYLKKMKQRINTEVVQLKYMESQQLNEPAFSQNNKKPSFLNALRMIW